MLPRRPSPRRVAQETAGLEGRQECPPHHSSLLVFSVAQTFLSASFHLLRSTLRAARNRRRTAFLRRYLPFCSSAESSGEEAAFPEREREEGFLVGFSLDCSMMKVVARLKRLVRSGKAFFVTTNLSRGLSRLVPKEHDLICQAVSQVCHRRRARLSGFVVMPEHLHLLILLALEDSLSRFVQDLKSGTARRINSRRRTSGAFWQKGFFDRFMRTPQEFLETLDYIHQNPVRKGLAEKAADWSWSSARAYARMESIIPVDFLDLPAQTERHFR